LSAALKDEDQSLQRSCLFHPKRDIFHQHEAHKTEEGYGKWACEYCGKTFYAENLLDDHFQRRHAKYLYSVSKKLITNKLKCIMHSSTIFQALPNTVDFLSSFDKVYLKQEEGFVLY